jgi:hypothetical protein
LRSLPSIFPPHFFTSTDDDSASGNAFSAFDRHGVDSADDNGVTRLGVLRDERSPYLHPLSELPPFPSRPANPQPSLCSPSKERLRWPEW